MIRWTIRLMLAFEIAWLIAPPVTQLPPLSFSERLEMLGNGELGLIEDRSNEL